MVHAFPQEHSLLKHAQGPSGQARQPPATSYVFQQEWDTVTGMIEYKLFLLAFKSVNNDGPSYLSDLLKFYIPSRQLRSFSVSRLLRIPSFRLKSFGQRKFSYQASVLWNSLPVSYTHLTLPTTFTV